MIVGYLLKSVREGSGSVAWGGCARWGAMSCALLFLSLAGVLHALDLEQVIASHRDYLSRVASHYCEYDVQVVNHASSVFPNGEHRVASWGHDGMFASDAELSYTSPGTNSSTGLLSLLNGEGFYSHRRESDYVVLDPLKEAPASTVIHTSTSLHSLVDRLPYQQRFEVLDSNLVTLLYYTVGGEPSFFSKVQGTLAKDPETRLHWDAESDVPRLLLYGRGPTGISLTYEIEFGEPTFHLVTSLVTKFSPPVDNHEWHMTYRTVEVHGEQLPVPHLITHTRRDSHGEVRLDTLCEVRDFAVPGSMRLNEFSVGWVEAKAERPIAYVQVRSPGPDGLPSQYFAIRDGQLIPMPQSESASGRASVLAAMGSRVAEFRDRLSPRRLSAGQLLIATGTAMFLIGAGVLIRGRVRKGG
ncbi:MAG: hypothetical protein KF858_14190 [Candidatus Sumerlaeia bacterium]|nr:hypothetical protein [Candidatus Sumerlaeia bacterium]